MALVRRCRVPVHRETLLGTLFGGRPDGPHRVLGFAIHLGISGGFGALYEAGFARIGRADWKRGLLLSPAHYLVSGVFYGAIDRVHPLVPAVYPDPGPFLERGGAKGPALLLLVKAAFGAAVGEIDQALERRGR